jgi:hypothetical protein
MRNNILHTAILLFLGATIVVGGWKVVDYSSTAGAAGEPVNGDRLPVGLQTEGRGLVVAVVHPHCPCTMATAREFQRLACRFPDSIDVLICAFCPKGESDSWIETGLIDVFKRVPNTRVVVDRDGEIGQQLGVYTSGHLLFYDDRGDLTFSGGITPGRGHEGSSAGATDLLAKINGGSTYSTHPVYGCALRSGAGDQR